MTVPRFEAIPRPTCEKCGRPDQAYYEDRQRHMAAAFRSGVTVGQISTAYGVSAEWAMKLIRERLGVEAVGEIIEMRHYNTCEMCGLRIGVDDEYAIVNDKRVHMDCVGEHLDT